jgi:tetratricopeptide (TPR) repeat protein
LFFIRAGAIYEGLVSVSSPQPEPDLGDPELMSRLVLSYDPATVPENPYGDPPLDAVLREYRQRLGDTSLLVPVAAMRCVRALIALSQGPALLVVGDKGTSRIEEIVQRTVPQRPQHGGAFSMDVNLHAIGRYVENLGGGALHTQQLDRHFKVAALLTGGPADSFPETRLAFRDAMDAFSPFDYHRLSMYSRKQEYEMPPDFVMALLKLGDWDPYVLAYYARSLARQADKMSDVMKLEVKRALERTWESFFPMSQDVAFEIANVFSSLNLRKDALRFYGESLKLNGPHHITLHNMGLCMYLLGQPEEALKFMDQSLEMKPDYGHARDWRNRIQAELSGS